MSYKDFSDAELEEKELIYYKAAQEINAELLRRSRENGSSNALNATLGKWAAVTHGPSDFFNGSMDPLFSADAPIHQGSCKCTSNDLLRHGCQCGFWQLENNKKG